jgi:Tfp pilus assembly protein PilF/ketosteroid isomerase-like protein
MPCRSTASTRFPPTLAVIAVACGLAGSIPVAAQPAAGPPAASAPASPESSEIQRLLKDGQHAQALKVIDEALSKNPRDAQMRFRRGVALSMLDRKGEALAVFQKLVDDHPDMPAPYNNMAVILGAQGDYEKARQALEKAIRTNPAYATAYQNLGDVYAQLASQAYSRALQLDKGDASVPPKLALLRELTTGANATPSAGPAATPVTASRSTARPAAPFTPPSSALASAPASATTVASAKPTPAPPPVPAASRAASTPIRVEPVAAASKPAASAPVAAATKPAASAPVAAATKPAASAAVTAATKPGSSTPVAAVSTPPPTASAATASKPGGVATAGATAKPAAAPASSPSPGNADIEAAVRAWAAAWSKRDMAAYYAAYAPEFSGQATSRKAWEQDRRDRIASRKQIKVEVSDLKITVNGDQATAKFRQAYSSDALSTTGRKTLQLVRSANGRWMIKQETVG